MYLTEKIKTKLEPADILLSLVNARHRKGITQAELAELAGIDVDHLWRIENGVCISIKKSFWNKLLKLIEEFEKSEIRKSNTV